MPKLIDIVVDNDPAMQDKYKRALEFWDNAYSYAYQAAPYATERINQLNQQAEEIKMGMQMVPPEIQKKITDKLKADLIEPVEDDTAQEYDAAWEKLGEVTQQLHKDLMPKMGNMVPFGMGAAPTPMFDQAAEDFSEMPAGPHMMPDGTMMGAY